MPKAMANHLIQREFPVCEDGGESKVLRSRTIEDRNQFRATPVKAWESTNIQTRGSPTKVSTPVSPSAAYLDLALQPPDLTVFILEAVDSARGSESEILLISPHLRAPIREMFPTPSGLGAWLDLQYDRFAQLATRGYLVNEPRESGSFSLPERTRPLLTAFGRELYHKFVPAAFKEAFWQLEGKLGSRFQTIQIYTNSPVLPWELIVPSRSDGSEEGNFLGIDFRIARWHVSTGTTQLDRPPPQLLFEPIFVIAPEEAGNLRLPHQADELKSLESLKGFQRLPARMTSVATALHTQAGGVIHFAGHGVVQQQPSGVFEYAIRLQDANLDLLTWRGLAAHQTGSHPFIFFNACEVGQANRVANFVDGWAPAVLEAGASGYVGGLWPLGDKGAAKFADYFYTKLAESLKDGPVAATEVLRDARRLFYETGDPTFLAYAYYGDANLRFVSASFDR
jgi:hypothetical protein